MTPPDPTDLPVEVPKIVNFTRVFTAIFSDFWPKLLQTHCFTLDLARNDQKLAKNHHFLTTFLDLPGTLWLKNPIQGPLAAQMGHF